MTVSRLAHIPGIGVDRMGNAADRAVAAGLDILRLENLDTDIPPPPAALCATHAAIGQDHANSYLPFLGLTALRQAAAQHVGRAAGRSYDGETECIISAGGLSGILNTLLALLEPGDEVIITDPAYAGLLNRIRLAGGVPRLIPLLIEGGGWRLDLDALAAAATPKVRAVLTMSPSMPSGIVHTAAEWAAIADVVARTNAVVIHDTAMERILYTDEPVTHPAQHPALADRVITAGSVSKEYRMIGWRVGWVVGPAHLMADIALVSLANVVCQVGIAMPGALAALTAADDGIAGAVATWKARRDVILSELSDLPVVRPDGGWSLLINTATLGLSPGDAAERALAKGGIAATPMAGWGDVASDYLRVVFANEPVERLVGIRDRLRTAWGT